MGSGSGAARGAAAAKPPGSRGAGAATAKRPGPRGRADVTARLRLAITRTARRLRQEAGGDLSPSLTAALFSVERHGPLTPSELAAHERVQRPTATRVLSSLEERGLVSRAPDPLDRRSALVTATPAGRELLRTLRSRKDLFLAQKLRHLDREELAVLERAAEILERALEDRS